ncbi:MAG: hypothetical protein JWR65_714 [Massilia sp.]|nr:hypothetical protein [Massilia sp.]
MKNVDIAALSLQMVFLPAACATTVRVHYDASGGRNEPVDGTATAWTRRCRCATPWSNRVT